MKSNSSPIKYLILKKFLKIFFSEFGLGYRIGNGWETSFYWLQSFKIYCFFIPFLICDFSVAKIRKCSISISTSTFRDSRTHLKNGPLSPDLVRLLFWTFTKDNEIDWSLWWVLCPLWVWKGFVIVGGIVGSISYCNDRDSNPETKTEFKAMLIALFIHSILLFFEILLCYQVNKF